MNLHQLEHLLALADTRHFAKAASKVHLSQPAFSRSIQALERHTNLLLFERKGGEIRPTPAGEFLIERARQLLLEARSVERDVQLYQKGTLGKLAFGVGPFPGATLLSTVVKNMRLHHPAVALRAEVASPAKLQGMLLQEDIEFFVADTGELTKAPYLGIEPLMRQYGGLYVCRNHPLAGQRCTFEQAWEYGVASVKLPDAMKIGLARALGQSGRHLPNMALECDDIHLLHQLAASTNTVVASTELAAKPWVTKGELVPLELADFPPLYSNISVVGGG
ncbi:LysR family transcriptional regulator, partial [Limnobacter sp.]|uniref:LysR family transcriptional regulator n=1 Tax=Limnobacter sp. TaxID=2003368 RepID=UPI003513DA84